MNTVDKDFIRNEWIPALRGQKPRHDGKPYQQGKACLRDQHNRFCCLGVAADLLSNDDMGWMPLHQEEGGYFGNEYTFNDGTEQENAYLPSSLAKVIFGDPNMRQGTLEGLYCRAYERADIEHIERTMPDYPNEVLTKEQGFSVNLAHLNDSGFTFDQIADVIEYWWLK